MLARKASKNRFSLYFDISKFTSLREENHESPSSTKRYLNEYCIVSKMDDVTLLF